MVYEVKISVAREIERDGRRRLDHRVRRILDEEIVHGAGRRTSP